VRVFAGAFVLALALAGCGSSGGGGGSASPDTIAQDAARTARAGSLKADFTIAGAGAQGKGSGVFNTGADRSAKSSMQIKAANHVSTLESIVAGNVLYMRSRAFAQAGVSGAKQWVKLDLGRLAQQRGLDLSSLVNASPTPTSGLMYLRGTKDVKKVGTESVKGTDTTHYRATVDLAQAAAKSNGASRESIKRVMQLSGVKTLPIDVWVDDQGYLRKIAWAEHTSPNSAAKVTMLLHGFGSPVTISPPSGKVIDLLQAGGGTG
jgi:hypothetical protein